MKNNYDIMVIILIFCGVNSSFIPKIHRSFIKTNKLTQNLTYLKIEKREILKTIDIYKKDIIKLKTEYYKEEIARNQLKMVKPGEQIYKVIK